MVRGAPSPSTGQWGRRGVTWGGDWGWAGGWLGAALGVAATIRWQDHGDHANWTGPPYLEEFILQRSNKCPENLFSIRRYNSATRERRSRFCEF